MHVDDAWKIRDLAVQRKHILTDLDMLARNDVWYTLTVKRERGYGDHQIKMPQSAPARALIIEQFTAQLKPQLAEAEAALIQLGVDISPRDD